MARQGQSLGMDDDLQSAERLAVDRREGGGGSRALYRTIGQCRRWHRDWYMMRA